MTDQPDKPAPVDGEVSISREESEKLHTLLRSVGHHGVDIGEGVYQITDDDISNARSLCGIIEQALSEQQGEG